MTEQPTELITVGRPPHTSVPTHIADYQVQRELGYGNGGGVYLARPAERLGLDQEFVAVKVFNGPCPDAAYDRAVEELRAVSALGSPHLAHI